MSKSKQLEENKQGKNTLTPNLLIFAVLTGTALRHLPLTLPRGDEPYTLEKEKTDTFSTKVG